MNSPIEDLVHNATKEGATRPKMVHFACGIKGIYKKQSIHPSSRYQSEVAAYILDDLLNFDLVPMTVYRELQGFKGSLQYFIKGAKPLRLSEKYKKSHKLILFDYIIQNKDRNVGNILMLGEREVAIDHGLTIRRYNVLGKVLNAIDHIRSPLGLKKILSGLSAYTREKSLRESLYL